MVPAAETEYPRSRTRKVGIHTAIPPSAKVMNAIPRVAVQNALLRSRPATDFRSGVSGIES